MGEEKKLWQSQTELVMAVGMGASLLSTFGVITLTPEQISGIAAALFALGGLTRKWSDGTKLVVKNSKIAQELLDGDSDLPTVEDVKADILSGAAGIVKVQKAAEEAGLTGDQARKLMAALKK
jgi:hypothetical protein